MALVSDNIPNLVNGISQQPAEQRLVSQVEEMDNFLPDVVRGATMRPPTETVARLTTSGVSDGAYVHMLARDATERYIAIIQNGSLRVFDLDGNEKTVNVQAGSEAYLSSATPQDDFRAVTVADYTFILNRSVTVLEGTQTVSGGIPRGYVWIRQGAYASGYNVVADTYGAGVSTPAASAPGDAFQVQTSDIANRLLAELNANQGFYDNFVVFREGSTLEIFRRDGADFSLQTSDSVGDTAMRVIKGTVQDFNDLPARFFENAILRVQGTEASAFDDYWVRFDNPSGIPKNGVWKETVKPDEPLGFQAVTMPHALIRESDGTFTFRPLDWADRQVGDSTSNPLPSFVGRKINDVFFARNRLGLLADENVIMSVAGSFFDFFKGSAIQTVDTDPIDVAVTSNSVAILQHAVPFNEGLLFFADGAQFVLDKTELLTPKTVGINLATEYRCTLRAKPVGAGSNVYFAANLSNGSAIREYYVDPDSVSKDAADVTAHVPSLIPPDVHTLTASSAHDAVFAVSPHSPNTLYGYRFYWSGDDKLQSAWFKWTLQPGALIQGAAMLGSELYLVVNYGGAVYIEKTTLGKLTADPGLPFRCMLDRRQTLTGTFDGENTIFRPLWADDALRPTLVSLGGGASLVGDELSYGVGVDSQGLYYAVAGNHPSAVVGFPYTARLVFSRVLMRRQSNQGTIPILSGRLQLRTFRVDYAESGPFTATVDRTGRATKAHEFTARIIGVTPIGEANLYTGSFRFPVVSRNDRATIGVSAQGPRPITLLSAGWEGEFTDRTRSL